MKVLTTLFITLTLFIVDENPSEDLWTIFGSIPFESRYVESEKASFYFPTFTEQVKRMEGTTVRVTGYYLPIDVSSDAVIISRYPMATCFFCGEAGPETVMMVYVKEDLTGLKMDEKVTFEGELQLNSTDVYQLAFIIKDARRL